jgi:hypothetical protein
MAYGRANAGISGASEDFEIAAFSELGQSSTYGGNILALVEDDNYIYAGGETTRTIKRYNKQKWGVIKK